MVGGYSLSALAKPLLTYASGGFGVLLLRGADRFGKGIRGAPRDSLLSREINARQRGRAFGVQRAMDHAGALLGGLVASGLLFMQWTTIEQLFWWSLVPGVAAVVVILLFVHESHPSGADSTSAQPAQKAPPQISVAGSWRQQSPNMKRYLLVLAIFALGNSTDMLLLKLAYDQFVSAGLTERTSYALLPLLWAWLHVVKSIGTPWGGRLSDRVGRIAAVQAGWLLYAAVYAGFALWSGAIGPWVLFGAYGVYYGLVEGPERALIADLTADPARRGMAYGLFHFVLGICALPASLLCAGLWWQFGHPVAFGAGAVLALVAAVLLPWALRGTDVIAAAGSQ
jgi:MFS family permease